MIQEGLKMCWVVVSDLEKAVTFYRDTLGLTVLEVAKEFSWAELSGPGGAKLGLAGAQSDLQMEAGRNAVVTFTVEDIERERRWLSESGVRVLGEVMEVPGKVRLQLCEDPDGNQFQLVQDLTCVSL